jgi:hypothetical protein
VTSHPQTWTGSPAFVGALSEEDLTFIQDVHDPAVIAQLTHTPRSALDRHRQPGLTCYTAAERLPDWPTP